MRTQTAKINKHVTWVNAAGKPRPATITAVIDQTHVNLRVVHTGETVANAVKQSADNQPSRWHFSDAFQNT